MKAVIQRVIDARVEVDEKTIGKIDSGLLVYLGVANDDTEKDADRLAEKIPNLRIFDDDNGVMNLSLLEINNKPQSTQRNTKKEENSFADFVSSVVNKILVVSQFTLLADARKGRRPSWNNAAPPEKAKELYEYFVKKIKEQNALCETGEFQAHMKVTYTNDGPVTILLDSKDSGKINHE